MPSARGPQFDWEQARRRLQQLSDALDAAGRLDPQAARRLMDERARHLAQGELAEQVPAELLELVTFHLRPETFALQTRFVREVMRMGEVTPLPGAPRFFRGVMNLRGEILPLVELRAFFGLPAAAAPAGPCRVMVLGQDRAELGMVVDDVAAVTTLRHDELQPLPGSVQGTARDFLLGVTPTALLILNGDMLLNDPRLVIDETELHP